VIGFAAVLAYLALNVAAVVIVAARRERLSVLSREFWNIGT
jgi:hypothetical protein